MKAQIKQILRIGRTPLTTVLAAAGMALVLSAPIAQAQDAPDEGESFGQWQGLAEGFVGRRRQPPKMDLPKYERQLANVQTRVQNLLKKKQALLDSLNGATDDGLADFRYTLKQKKRSAKGTTKRLASIEKKLEKLEQQIAKAKQREDKRAAKQVKNFGDDTAVWLRTGEEGLYSVSITELAEKLGEKVNKVRSKAKKGQLILTTAEELDSETADRAVSWHFDEDADSVLFVAEAIDSFYTGENAYRFSLGGKKSKQAAPMKVTKAASTNSTGFPAAFSETLRFEEEPDFFYFTWAINNDPDIDFWFWELLFGTNEVADVSLHIPTPALSGSAQMRISLRGFTAFGGANEHEVSAELNNNSIGTTLVWYGMEAATLVADFDQSLLDPSGNNTLILRQGGVELSGEVLDQIEIDYQRLPVANAGKLWLHNVAAGTQVVSGFSNENITIIESPDGEAVLRKDILIEPVGDGWSVSFDAVAGADYFLSETSAIAASSVSSDSNAGLRSATNSADYLIIAPRDFSESAEEMASYRASRFSNVKIIWLDDIYNEFSAGREDAHAITRFMTYAVNQWSIVPTAVLLHGNGSVDQKDRMGYADNFIPFILAANPWGITSSDSKLLGFEHGAPFAIGRLPITSDEEGLAYINKLRTHEAALVENLDAVLVSDNPDDAGNFYKNSNALADRLTSFSFSPITKLYHPETNVQESLANSSTWDTQYVNYDGHGSFTQLGSYSELFIKADDALLLQNSIYPIFTALTCSAGNDIHPGRRSLASNLVVNPTGGAIASIAASGPSLDAGAQQLSNALVDSLYGSDRTVGGALQDAKIETIGVIPGFMAPMYSVIGEPAVYGR